MRRLAGRLADYLWAKVDHPGQFTEVDLVLLRVIYVLDRVVDYDPSRR